MKPELLAPAGDFECLNAALRFGADAVYLGGPMLQLRANRAGFSEEDLADAVLAVHAAGKKIYVTVNSFVENEELLPLADYAKRLFALGVDAAIVSDLGAFSLMREAAQKLPLHVSTQANIMNYRAARVWHELGAERIVLARELSIEQIAEIRAKTPPALELEAFVHGAMCMAYSGRCIMSSFLTGRSGNRGGCAQPCRWNYRVEEEKRPGEFFSVTEEEGRTAIFSSMDLNCLSILEQLEKAGVSSFKIEGRMKTPYYVATVTNAYRAALDGSAPEAALLAELDCVSHRPYSTGFYLESPKHTGDGDYRRDCTFIGTVEAYENGMVTLRQRGHFAVGERLEIIAPGRVGLRFPVLEIRGEDGLCRETAPHPLELVTIPCPYVLEPGDLLRRREREEEA